MISNDFSASRAEVVRTFLKKSIYDAEAKQARIQLLAVPLQVFRALWDDLIAPKASRFNFDLVQNRFGQRQTGSMNPELAANLRVIYGLFARIATPMIWTLAN